MASEIIERCWRAAALGPRPVEIGANVEKTVQCSRRKDRGRAANATRPFLASSSISPLLFSRLA
jgi:hypothetical protein